jgi:plasmid stability protein
MEDVMATLNVKDFPDALYRRLKARARRECRSVSQQVVYMLRELTERPERLSLKQLKGLGKESWKAVDAAQFVQSERDDWS